MTTESLLHLLALKNAQVEDRIIREAERLHLTSISRAQCYQLEKRGLFPQRIKLGNRSVGWRLSSIIEFIKNPMRPIGEV